MHHYSILFIFLEPQTAGVPSIVTLSAIVMPACDHSSQTPVTVTPNCDNHPENDF